MNKINIPDGWREFKLGDLARIERGRFSPRPRNDPRYYGGDIPFVQTGDVSRAGIYIKNYSQTLNEKGLSVSKLFPKNTILMTIAANIGDVAILNFDSACPDSLVAFLPKDDTCNRWFFYALKTMKNNFDCLSTQNAQKNLSLEKIKPIKILLPPLIEQKAIAGILEKWDEAIEKTSKLIEAKKKRFEWLLNNLIKQQQGYEYESLKLVDCCKKITTGKLDANAMVKNGKYRFYTCAKEHYFIDDYKFDGEALLVSGNGANVGYIHYYKGKFNAYQRTYVLMNFYKNIHYIKYCLDKNLNKRINSQVNGGNTPYIKLDTISEMIIDIPSSKILQENVVNTLNTTKKEIAILEEILANYKSQKKGLMQKLLTGKIRVNHGR